ncbi:MAG TPA: transposase [Ignavibacteriales bacterium]|nr:transposase [Ignavibacteriales bacterium]
MGLYKNKFKTISIRLQNWNYANPWWYFVTINTKNHKELFGEINSGKMILNDVGKMAEKIWLDIPEHFSFAELDYFVIMPNHIHGILILNDHCKDVACNVSTLAVNAKFSKLSPKKYTLSTVIRSYKSAVTKWCNKNEILFEWQPRYFDRIIRNETELYNIRKYIEQNPLKWEIEKNNPDNIDYDLL